MDRRLIEHFVNSNLLSRQDMQRIILRASKSKTGLVTQLLDAEVIDDEALADQIAAFYNYEPLDSGAFFMDDSALGLLDVETALKSGALPYGYEPGSTRVYVAVYEPDQSKEALAKVEAASGQPPVVRIAPKNWLSKAIPFYYNKNNSGAQIPARNDSRSQNAWTQRPRSSGRIQRPGSGGGNDFGSDAPMLSGMHRISSRVGQSPRTANRPQMKSRSSNLPPDDFDEFEALLRDDGPDLSPRASVIGRPRIARRNEDSSFGDFSGSNPVWNEQDNYSGRPNTSRGPWDNSPPPIPQDNNRHGSGTFSLFDNPEPEHRDENITLHEIVEKHHQQINNLKSEAQRQREVIQALADLLIEARVISRRDLTSKLQSLRKK